jgi:SAM-dependent methyltransferase
MEVKEDGYGRSPEEIEYWLKHRTRADELYPSERHFFFPSLKKATKVLDIGCAAGGSANFAREINPSVSYVGVDISAPLIEAAQLNYGQLPDTKFLHFNGKNIPIQDDEVDLSFSFGVFHHLPHWKEMAQEALRVSRKFVLFDLRIWEKPTLTNPQESYQKIALSGKWDEKSVIPYVLVSYNDLLSFAHLLSKQGVDVKCFGYHQKPTSLAVTPSSVALMLSVLLEKGAKAPKVTLEFT